MSIGAEKRFGDWLKSKLTLLVMTLTFIFPTISQARPGLELSPLSDNVLRNDWAGGCWFQRGENTSGRGGELMFLIRGEGKGSEALLNLDGQVERVPFAYFLSQSKEFRLNARYSSVYQNEKLKIQVTTIVTEVPEGTECAGDCSESSAFAAHLKIQKAKLLREYQFNSGACGL